MPGERELLERAREWVAPRWNAHTASLPHARLALRARAAGADLALRLAALTHDMERHFPGPDSPKMDARRGIPNRSTSDSTRSARRASSRPVWPSRTHHRNWSRLSARSSLCTEVGRLAGGRSPSRLPIRSPFLEVNAGRLHPTRAHRRTWPHARSGSPSISGTWPSESTRATGPPPRRTPASGQHWLASARNRPVRPARGVGTRRGGGHRWLICTVAGPATLAEALAVLAQGVRMRAPVAGGARVTLTLRGGLSDRVSCSACVAWPSLLTSPSSPRWESPRRCRSWLTRAVEAVAAGRALTARC